MAAALVQHLGEVDRNGTGSDITTITMSKTVASGNTIIAAVGTLDDIGGGDPSCIDSLGNTYTLVEVRNGTYDAAIFYARVTAPGTLTSITFQTATSRYVCAEAAEFSGVGALSSVGSGTATGTGSPQTGVVNKAIPADGIAVWFTYGNVSDTYSAGSASGTPSATPVLVDAHDGGPNASGGLLYALGGAGGTTGFTGNTATAAAGTYSNAGAVFAPAVGIPPATSGFRSLRSLRTLRSLGR